MARFGRRVRKVLIRLVLIAVVALVALTAVGTTNGFPPGTSGISGAPGVPGSTGSGQSAVPKVPSADQVALGKASATQGGLLLVQQGYTAKQIVQDRDLVSFLDEQQKQVGVTNPGPYAVFSLGQQLGSKPGEGSPDVMVDTTSGVIVAASQEYTNGRGAACFVSRDIRELRTVWMALNVYMWHKSMPQAVPVTRTDLPQLPQSMGTVQCFVYPTS
jgi:hypothetical protein